jgi:hypothetical protein
MSNNIYADNIIMYCGQVSFGFVQKIIQLAVRRKPTATIVFNRPESQYVLDEAKVINGLKAKGFSHKMEFPN